MVDQASVSGSAVGHAFSPGSVAGADRGVGEFINDLATLAELQAELAALNLKEAARRAVVPIGLIVVNLTTLAAGVTASLIGLALVLATVLKIHPGWAMILTAGMAIVLASPLAAFGVMRVRSSVNSFRGSHEELRRNLTWLRAVLISRGHFHRSGSK